jgi:hypothetical protein
MTRAERAVRTRDFATLRRLLEGAYRSGLLTLSRDLPGLGQAVADRRREVGITEEEAAGRAG